MTACRLTKKQILDYLAEGLKYERAAIRACEKLRREIYAPDDKAAIERILADEKRHVRMVEELIRLVEGIS